MRNLAPLMKIAGFESPSTTVGDFMNRWNADIYANQSARRSAFDRINAAGIDVKQPASRLPYIIGGGVIGRAAASYLGANPFWKRVATIGGAVYGNKLYNKEHPKPFAPDRFGVVTRQW